MSWKPEVYAEGEWCGNGMAFATKEEAERWGFGLLMRCILFSDARAVESDQPVNYQLTDKGILIRLETREMSIINNGQEYPVSEKNIQALDR
jgi:hypothetical protein